VLGAAIHNPQTLFIWHNCSRRDLLFWIKFRQH